MTKMLTIHPGEARARGHIEFVPIPLNQYDRTMRQELDRFAPAEIVRMYRDMLIIRIFETMLSDVKLQGGYKGVEYQHRGPGHLSIGQEAAAVGQAFLLGVDDHIYGSHRSHGEVLAKGLSAVEKLEDAALMEIMRGYFDGRCLRVVDDGLHGSVRELAIEYLMYGSLAEIFGREAGFNKGFGGSMHVFFPPFGIFPNNAIVGGSGDIAVGAALFKHVNKAPGIVICNIGDASSSCGPVWEGLCFATMDQFRTLWEREYRCGLPLIMNFANNFYGMGGQPVGETMGHRILARLGAGLNPEQMHAERVDGYNPLAVVDAIARKKEVLLRGDGPVLLDTVTYRFSGHSPSDASSYREKSEVEMWQRVDPIITFAREMVEAEIVGQGDLEKIGRQVEDLIMKVYRKAIDPGLSPRLNLMEPGCELERVMFSNRRIERLASRQPETLIPKEENPRLHQLARRSRSAYDDKGQRLPNSKCIGIRDALFEAILDRFYEDPTLIAYGEENRDWGGAFGVYRGLTEALPYHRLFNTPIAEGAIVGTAVGYALEGGRALVELMYCDFMGRAGDEIFNQLAKWQSMSGGLLKMPVVLRVSVGSKYGAQHSQDWSAMCAHVPGLKVVFPATPYDAKGLMYSALLGSDPVIFFESQRIYDMAEEFVPGGVPAHAYEIPIGEPDVKKSGKDLTILSSGATLYRVLEAAAQLRKSYGVECEIIDARSLVPFRYEKVLESVRKTRKILLACDACVRGSALQTMATNISLFAFDELDAPPVVVGARNWITPADEVEDAFFPFPADILDAVHEHILPLKGYGVQRKCDRDEILRRSALGV